jgi:hypothetical protein
MPKVKIPKRVAGVKIPKKVRKKAKQAIKMAENPALQKAAAAALTAAAGARAAKSAANDSEGTRTVRFDGEALVEAIQDAALEGISRFLQGFEEGLRKAAAAAEEAADDADAPPRGNGRRPGASA